MKIFSFFHKKLHKAVCASLALISTSLLLCGYSKSVSMEITLDGSDLGTLVDFEATYTGELVATPNLSKDDFEVYGLYTFEGSDDKQKFGPVVSSKFSLGQSTLSPGTNEVEVSYGGFTKTVTIVCSDEGYITVASSGLSTNATVTDVKQSDDDNLVNKGSVITYTFSKEEVQTASEEMEEAICNSKDESDTKVEVVSVYDVTVTRNTGTESEKIETLNESVQLVFPIDSEYQSENRTFYMLKNHNGTVTRLDDLDTDPTTVTIETSSFSEYTMMYEENVEKENIDVTVTSEYKGDPYIGTAITADMFESKAILKITYKDGTESTETRKIAVKSIDLEKLAEGENIITVTSSYQGKDYTTQVKVNGIKKPVSDSGKEDSFSDSSNTSSESGSVTNALSTSTTTAATTNATANASGQHASAKTGDSLMIFAWIVLFTLSMILIVVSYKKVRKK